MTDNNNETQQSVNAEVKPFTSIDQITRIIKKKDVAYASHYAVPSLNKTVPFNEINTSQQKRLVKSVIDSPVYNTEFIYTFREILRENCQEPLVDIDSLTILDKLVLALGLRIKSIGSNVDIEIETKANKKVNVSLDIEKILQLALASVQNISNEIIEDSYFRIECNVPSIGTEFKLERELRNKTGNIEIENIEELRKTVGDAFISEIVKYIGAVSVKVQDEGQEEKMVPVEWQSFNYVDRIKVIETFKMGLLKNVLNYINNVRKEIDKIELVKFEFEGETYERRLSIDGGFFTIS